MTSAYTIAAPAAGFLPFAARPTRPGPGADGHRPVPRHCPRPASAKVSGPGAFLGGAAGAGGAKPAARAPGQGPRDFSVHRHPPDLA